MASSENEVLDDITKEILQDLEAAKSMAEQNNENGVNEDHMHILANIQLPGEGQFLNKNCLKYHYSNLISNNADGEENEPLGTSDFVANGVTIQNHRFNFEELLEKSKEAQQLIQTGASQGIQNRSRMIYSENNMDEGNNTTGFMRSDVSSLKKQLSTNFSGTKDRRGSSSVADSGRKIQILSTDEIAGLSKRKRKRISVVKDKNSEKMSEKFSEGNSNENDKADDTVEFQIPAQHNQIPLQKQHSNVSMNQQHMGIPNQNYQNPYPPGYSVQTFNENTPYQQPYTPYQQHVPPPPQQIHHYQDPNYSVQHQNQQFQQQNNAPPPPPPAPSQQQQQQQPARQNSQTVIKLKEIQRTYDAVGLSIHSSQSISALKSATDLQQPARDKILKFLNKEYIPSALKEEIRLSLEKQVAQYFDNENRPLETYMEKLYILCQDGNIELHTRILVESGRS